MIPSLETSQRPETISWGIIFPAIISMVVLFVLVLFIQQEGGPSISVLYIFSLFIAGGYFFIAAATIYFMKQVRSLFPSKKATLTNLQSQFNTYKSLKKKFEKQYYTREIDEETFKSHIRNCEEKLAYFEAEIEKAQGVKSDQK